ncbi:MAG TPA: LysM domain-containing protein [Gaiellaceae bacterium]|nr:LysM domain-containing protein [Gaiellaceae bacterium]
MNLSRRNLARFAAPAAFLLGVTVAVLLVRAGIGGGSAGASTTRLTRSSTVVGVFSIPKAKTATGSGTATGAAAGKRYYTVRKGDTFSSIAVRERTTVSALEQLNPGVSSNTLQVGQKLRVK